MTATIMSIIALVLAIACIAAGIKLIRGSWQIPPEKREKYAIWAIGASLILGLANLVLALKPMWLQRAFKSET